MPLLSGRPIHRSNERPEITAPYKTETVFCKQTPMDEPELTHRFFETYPKLVIGTWTHCAYCGEPSTCRDHLWPFKMLSVADRKRYEPQIGPQAMACRDCNGLLSDKYFETFETRAKNVSEKLYLRAHQTGAKWSKAEIRELRGKLRKFVDFKQTQRRCLMERSQWFYSFNYLKNLESLPLEPILNHELPKFKSSYFHFFASTVAAINSGVAAWTDEQRRSQEALRSRACSSPTSHGIHQCPPRQT